MTLRRRAGAPALTAIALTALLSACGGDDGKAKAHDAYVKSADAVCARAERISQAMNTEYGKAISQGGPEAAAVVIRGFQPVYRQQMDRLARIKPPTDETARAKAVVDALSDRADIVAALPRALAGNDQQLLVDINKAQRKATTRAAKLAKDYGFKVCGAGGGTGAAPQG
jgi:hypothetical protein